MLHHSLCSRPDYTQRFAILAKQSARARFSVTNSQILHAYICCFLRSSKNKTFSHLLAPSTTTNNPCY
ncbi:unnamed protein product [Linum tenue]|uniref:Uncharacterized protein n=1 Tax=Linum tenue TaxID=586396 RepID=A0AAV0HVM3_9ROSI|nr:unnamed protein product [Linum tenue]